MSRRFNMQRHTRWDAANCNMQRMRLIAQQHAKDGTGQALPTQKEVCAGSQICPHGPHLHTLDLGRDAGRSLGALWTP